MNIKKFFNDWWENPKFHVHAAHFLLGELSVTAPFFFSPNHGLMPSIISTGVLIAYGVVKEMVLDPEIEGEPFLWQGFTDMCFLYGGAAMVWGIKWLI